jgi:hypothetical protein
MGKKQSVYIYGIASKELQAVECQGIGNPPQPVRVEPLGSVTVILTYLTPDFEEVGIEDAVQHVRVLEKAMENATVLPIRFGTVADSLAEFKTMVISNQFAIQKELHRLKGKYEVGIKGYWRKETILEELRASKEYTALVEEAQQNSRAAMELGQMVEATVNEWRVRLEEQVHPLLARLAAESVISDATSVEMVYNSSFLVTPEQELRLKEKLIESAEKTLNNRIEFHFTTKLPPYNFIKLRLKWGS